MDSGNVAPEQVRAYYRQMRIRLLLLVVAGFPVVWLLISPEAPRTFSMSYGVRHALEAYGVLAVQWTAMTFLRQARETGRIDLRAARRLFVLLFLVTVVVLYAVVRWGP